MASKRLSLLKSKYPWLKSPYIINGPMAAFATGPLAAAVTSAGGFGMIGSTPGTKDMSDLHASISHARDLLRSQPQHQHTNATTSSSHNDSGEPLPIGIGFLCFMHKPADVLPLIQKHNPAVVWLFGCPTPADYAAWTSAIRSASSAAIWIQTGNVASALEIAQKARPDVLVAQGTDAGGHGLANSAGVISLVPEVRAALDAAGFAEMPVMAAGGIADGRGVAAALALGADGVVMGTRFLASEEVKVPHPAFREAIVGAKDGGVSTARNTTFDEMRPQGNNWPLVYDGRGLKSQSLTDVQGGMGLEEARKKIEDAKKGDDGGFGYDSKVVGGSGRGLVWAGTGVGLVKKVQKAGEIVEEVREEAVKILRETTGRFGADSKI